MRGALGRREPVVLAGRHLPSLVGATPGDVVAFSRANGTWTQVPVQIDEKLRADFCRIYAAAKLGTAAPCKTSLRIEAEFYADPATYTGADPDPAFDADDELVFLSSSGGDRWSGIGEPAGIRAGSGVEVELTDGEERAFAYLFVRADPALLPSAGQDLVSYRQTFVGVPAGFDYKNDYPFAGRGSCGYSPGSKPVACDPPILEDSVVKTGAYERHFSARWVTDGLRITQAGASGVNLLDLAQARFAPNVCGRTVSTFSTAEGAFVANIDGPLRAIRSYLGANSGPLTQRTHLFYETSEVVQTMLRVHQLGSLMDVQDYASSAQGMTYFNSENTGGVPIDGVPDAISTAVPRWELVTGPGGSIVHALEVRTSQPLAQAGYYLDDANADEANDQCELSNVLKSPDRIAWGQSGVRFTEPLPDTDPRNGSKAHIFLERRTWYEGPSFGVREAEARASRGPIAVRVANVPATTDGRCGDGACDPWENSVGCASDCSTGGAVADGCGDGTCAAGEQALNCAQDCWTPALVPFADCLETKCAAESGACGDEAPCVDLVVCVAECVAGGEALQACETSCGAVVTTTAEQKSYADVLLKCATRERCAP